MLSGFFFGLLIDERALYLRVLLPSQYLVGR